MKQFSEDALGSSDIQLFRAACTLLHSGFLLGLLFDPKDRGGKSLRNIDERVPNYTLQEHSNVYSHRCENLRTNKSVFMPCFLYHPMISFGKSGCSLIGIEISLGKLNYKHTVWKI
jgi:hypothetical protein